MTWRRTAGYRQLFCRIVLFVASQAAVVILTDASPLISGPVACLHLACWERRISGDFNKTHNIILSIARCNGCRLFYVVVIVPVSCNKLPAVQFVLGRSQVNSTISRFPPFNVRRPLQRGGHAVGDLLASTLACGVVVRVAVQTAEITIKDSEEKSMR